IATGQLSREGNSDLRFSLTSTSAEQIQTIAYSFEELKKPIDEYEPQISGDLKFGGRVTGPLKDPTIEGDLNLASVALHDEPLGSLTGHGLFSPTEVRFENGTLTAAGGGTAKFTYAAPLDEAATEGHLDATLDRISSETLIAAAGLPSSQKFITGEVSGEAHLTGLPGSPRGNATIDLINGTVAGQTAELATASLVFDGNTARLDRAEVRLSQGRIFADGNLDLKSNAFQVKGRAENVDLAGVAKSAELTNLSV